MAEKHIILQEHNFLIHILEVECDADDVAEFEQLHANSSPHTSRFFPEK